MPTVLSEILFVLAISVFIWLMFKSLTILLKGISKMIDKIRQDIEN